METGHTHTDFVKKLPEYLPLYSDDGIAPLGMSRAAFPIRVITKSVIGGIYREEKYSYCPKELFPKEGPFYINDGLEYFVLAQSIDSVTILVTSMEAIFEVWFTRSWMLYPCFHAYYQQI